MCGMEKRMNQIKEMYKSLGISESAYDYGTEILAGVKKDKFHILHGQCRVQSVKGCKGNAGVSGQRGMSSGNNRIRL